MVLPIALRNALPSLGNNFISLFKDTSIAAVIAVPELTFQARKINNESFRVIEVWLAASLHLHRHLRPDRAGAAPPRSALPEILRRAMQSFLSVLDSASGALLAGFVADGRHLGRRRRRPARCSASSSGWR